jgi:hypothetical protein
MLRVNEHHLIQNPVCFLLFLSLARALVSTPSLDTRFRVDLLSTTPLSDSLARSLHLFLTSYLSPSYLGRYSHLAAATLATFDIFALVSGRQVKGRGWVKFDGSLVGHVHYVMDVACAGQHQSWHQFSLPSDLAYSYNKYV